MRTKHGLIDFEDVYVEPNVWRQLGLTGRCLGAFDQVAKGRLPVVEHCGGLYCQRT